MAPNDVNAGVAAARAQLLGEAEAFVRASLAHDSSGHDWDHIARVRRLAMTIGYDEGADLYICQLAALLHDVADEKIAGDEETGLARVRDWLTAHGAESDVFARVMEIVATMSFAGGHRPAMASLEGRVVQDADRLDALGAVGVARAFAFGATRGRPMYDPEIPPRANMSREEYRQRQSPTINHFYEKLLLLKDRLNTSRARQLAEERHRFMLAFLDQFYAEWEGRA
jgi:uncharacterized protein